jgi:hypothetical protein
MAVAFDKLKFAVSAGNNPVGAIAPNILKNLTTIDRNPNTAAFMDDHDCGLLAAARAVLNDPSLTKHQLMQMFRNLNLRAGADALAAQTVLEPMLNWMLPRVLKKHYSADWNAMMTAPISAAERVRKQRLGEQGVIPNFEELRFLSHFAGRNLHRFTGAEPVDVTPPGTAFTNFTQKAPLPAPLPIDKFWESPEGLGYEDGELMTNEVRGRKVYYRNMDATLNRQQALNKLRNQFRAMSQEEKNNFDLKTWFAANATPNKNKAAEVPSMLENTLSSVFNGAKKLPVIGPLIALIGGLVTIFMKMNAVLTLFAQKIARMWKPDAPITPETDPEVFQHPETARFVALVAKLPNSAGLNQMWIANPGSPEVWARLKEELEANGLFTDLDRLLRQEEKEILEKDFQGLERDPYDGQNPMHRAPDNGVNPPAPRLAIQPIEIFRNDLKTWRNIPLNTASEEFRAVYMEVRQEMARAVKEHKAEVAEPLRRLRALEERRDSIIKELAEAENHLEVLEERQRTGVAVNPADVNNAQQRMANAQAEHREIVRPEVDQYGNRVPQRDEHNQPVPELDVHGQPVFDAAGQAVYLSVMVPGDLIRAIDAARAPLQNSALRLAQRLDTIFHDNKQILDNESESHELRHRAARAQLDAAIANPPRPERHRAEEDARRAEEAVQAAEVARQNAERGRQRAEEEVAELRRRLAGGGGG